MSQTHMVAGTLFFHVLRDCVRGNQNTFTQSQYCVLFQKIPIHTVMTNYYIPLVILVILHTLDCANAASDVPFNGYAPLMVGQGTQINCVLKGTLLWWKYC